jgi:hypothetical protein
MSLYLVVAYRGGWTNTDRYIVYGGPEESKARALALQEARDRGDKYGCAVYEFDADGTAYRRVAYVCSAHGESEPRHNPRLPYFESLGRFMERLAGGAAYLPDPRHPGHLQPAPVEPPPIVVEEVARQRRFLEAAERELAASCAADDGALRA